MQADARPVRDPVVPLALVPIASQRPAMALVAAVVLHACAERSILLGSRSSMTCMAPTMLKLVERCLVPRKMGAEGPVPVASGMTAGGPACTREIIMEDIVPNLMLVTVSGFINVDIVACFGRAVVGVSTLITRLRDKRHIGGQTSRA